MHFECHFWLATAGFDVSWIIVRTLNVIFGSPPPIQLMKMDVQGFECKILQGARGRVLPHVSSVKVEIESVLLISQGCQVQTLLLQLTSVYHLMMYDDDTGKIVPMPPKINSPIDIVGYSHEWLGRQKQFGHNNCTSSGGCAGGLPLPAAFEF